MASIPKIFHRILVGGYDPGADAHRWWARFGEMHPGWELTTWTDPVRPEDYELGRLFASCRHGAQLADLIRIELLWQHGGVYVDSDIEPLQPFDPLLDEGFFIGTMDGWQLTNAVIGCEPRHPALRVLMDRLLEYDAIPDLPIQQTTGPYLYTRTLADRDDVVVVPRECFYPNRPWIETDHSGSTRHSFCEHHWAASWIGPDRAASGVHAIVDSARRRVGGAKSAALRTGRKGYSAITASSRKTLVGQLGDGRHLVDNEDGFSTVCELTGEDPARWSGLTRDDRAMLSTLELTLRPGDWCAVIGAGDGIAAVAAARRTANLGKVIAYEPDARKAQLLADNALLNQSRGLEIVDDLSAATRPLDLAGAAVPLRLALVTPGHLDSAALAWLRVIVDAGKVDFLLLPIARSPDSAEWELTLDLVDHVAAQPGARLASLNHRGEPTAITPGEIRTIERVDHFRVQFSP